MKTAIISALLAVAAPTVTLNPAQLDRGPDVSIPHVEGRVLVDGSTRIPFAVGSVTLLGTSPVGYVVHLMKDDGTRSRVVTVSDEGERRTLVRGVGYAGARLSADGRQLLTVPRIGPHRSRVVVTSVVTGATTASRSFRGSVSLLDADRGRAVLGSWSPDRTFTWRWGPDQTRRINDDAGYVASISGNRVAALTGDPYLGGCSVVTDLAGHRVSRSCSDRVVAISPSGHRVVTVGIIDDGPGSSAATLRRANGRTLATYRAPYVFGSIRFEDESTLLLETFTTRKVTTVRCALTDCERASRTTRSPIA